MDVMPITPATGRELDGARAPERPTTPVIEVRGLTKRYGDTIAVDGIDLRVWQSEIFALLGPNGAGKTTTLEMLEGYRRPDAGTISVLGQDPARAGLDWRARIGLVLQASKLPEELTVSELVSRYAGYYPHPRDVDETIELVGLSGKRKARAGQLSGGQQRRLDVAIALVGDPDLVFLDEPTTGFDPAARRQAWSMVENLRTLGKSVLLTTHYMDEAEGAGRPPRGDRRGAGRRRRDPRDRRRPRHRPGAVCPSSDRGSPRTTGCGSRSSGTSTRTATASCSPHRTSGGPPGNWSTGPATPATH